MKPVQVTDALQEYMEALLPARDPVLRRLEAEAEREGIPIIGPHEGMLLYLLVRVSGAGRLLELGTATGYSGIWLARGSDEARLTTFETDPARADRAERNFKDAGLEGRVRVRREDAVAALQTAADSYDLCFVDILNSLLSEREVEAVFDACCGALEPGGLLIADNALRQGEVLRPDSDGGRKLARYNELVSGSAELESVVIPLRDGVSVARRR